MSSSINEDEKSANRKKKDLGEDEEENIVPSASLPPFDIGITCDSEELMKKQAIEPEVAVPALTNDGGSSNTRGTDSERQEESSFLVEKRLIATRSMASRNNHNKDSTRLTTCSSQTLARNKERLIARYPSKHDHSKNKLGHQTSEGMTSGTFQVVQGASAHEFLHTKQSIANRSAGILERRRHTNGEEKLEEDEEAAQEQFSSHQGADWLDSSIQLRTRDQSGIRSVPATAENQMLMSQTEQFMPGAFAIGRLDFIAEEGDSSNFRQTPSSLTEPGDDEERRATTIKATLVDDSDLASATVIDKEAEEKAQQKSRTRAYLLSFVVTSIAAAVIAISVVFTRPEKKFVVTPSPTVSSAPSLYPSESPSLSPSTSFFGFLASNSFDGGLALTTNASSQQRAMAWVESEVYDGSMDYNLLQYYILAVIYFETFGDQWFSTLSPTDELPDQWLSLNAFKGYSFCYWRGVHCNGSVITSLQLSGEGLVGIIPPEIAALDPSLSKTRFHIPLQ